jgi:deoxyribodipyrimidine photo-lyase
VSDFDPLKIKEKWKRSVAKRVGVPFHEVDARNTVPCWVASDKREYGAFTLRKKIHRLVDDYLAERPTLRNHPHARGECKSGVDWKSARDSLDVDMSVLPVERFKPGQTAAVKALRRFIDKKLLHYDSDRNAPSKGGQSDLSPYLHFGQISSRRIAVEVLQSDAPRSCKKAFVEELIVRRELSDNFCFYCKEYDSLEALPEWSRRTLKKHERDRREYLYTLREFEEAKTHDEAWNAAQAEMVVKGKMHGYMRMYWAKKILEWSPSPKRAMETAIYLNDRYELDGRDTNGYAGIMWSIGGLHDRPWGERRVFGSVRYMSYNGLKSKFDIERYIEQNQMK